MSVFTLFLFGLVSIPSTQAHTSFSALQKWKKKNNKSKVKHLKTKEKDEAHTEYEEKKSNNNNEKKKEVKIRKTSLSLLSLTDKRTQFYRLQMRKMLFFFLSHHSICFTFFFILFYSIFNLSVFVSTTLISR